MNERSRPLIGRVPAPGASRRAVSAKVINIIALVVVAGVAGYLMVQPRSADQRLSGQGADRAGISAVAEATTLPPLAAPSATSSASMKTARLLSMNPVESPISLRRPSYNRPRVRPNG